MHWPDCLSVLSVKHFDSDLQETAIGNLLKLPVDIKRIRENTWPGPHLIPACCILEFSIEIVMKALKTLIDQLQSKTTP